MAPEIFIGNGPYLGMVDGRQGEIGQADCLNGQHYQD
jgi:hypothetical protein